jgi:hypothetical protein
MNSKTKRRLARPSSMKVTKKPSSMKVSKKDRPWYRDVNFVRPKVRHSWTDNERGKIYTLRMAGVSVDDIIIIMKLKTGRIPVYNLLREIRSVKKGRCSCGRKLTQREIDKQKDNVHIRCTKCLKANSDLKKKLRKKYLRKGLCGICGKRKKMKGYTTCKLCLSADYRRSYVQGLCGKCHTNPIDEKRSRSLCHTCLDHNKRHIKHYRRKLQEA